MTNLVHFDRLGRAVAVDAASPDAQRQRWTVGYDGAGRAFESSDPEGNESRTVFDADGNAIRHTRVEKSPSGLVAAETFVTIAVHDALGRTIRTTDNAGHTYRMAFDCRGNLVESTDAQTQTLIPDPLGLFQGLINGPGNRVQTLYDGVSRPIETRQYLHVGGNGDAPIDASNPANPDGIITVRTEWDANSRVQARIDDKGNRTESRFDDLNRIVEEVFADGKKKTAQWDADSNLLSLTDQNGSFFTFAHDGLGRRLATNILRAAGIGGTTLQTMEYDGLSRPTRWTDDNDPDSPADDSVVTRAYDSLSRPLEEVQNGYPVSCEWRADDQRSACIYPNGNRLEADFDRLDRPTRIRFAGRTEASYEYLGSGRVLERVMGNGSRLTFLNSTRDAQVGYDAIGRITRMRHEDAEGNEIVTLDYTYDRKHRRLTERTRFGAQDALDQATYDSYRLTRFDQNVAATGNIPVATQTWQLDGVANWVKTVEEGVTKDQSINEMNEYDSFAGVALSHDDNGNTTFDAESDLEFDALDRLIKATDRATGKVLALYAYHADNRRFRRTVVGQSQDLEPPPGRRRGQKHGRRNAQGQTTVSDYVFDGWRLIEERSSTGSVVAQWVDGNGIDEHVMMSVPGIGARYYYHEDNRPMNVVALSDDSGRVVDRFRYTAYGQVSFLDKDGNLRDNPAVPRNPYLFQGRQFDSETGLYYLRNRYLDPDQGRFVSRDPLGLWGDPSQNGNGQSFVGADPINGMDPLGLGPDHLGFEWVQGGADDCVSWRLYRTVYSGTWDYTGTRVFVGNYDPNTGQFSDVRNQAYVDLYREWNTRAIDYPEGDSTYLHRIDCSEIERAVDVALVISFTFAAAPVVAAVVETFGVVEAGAAVVSTAKATATAAGRSIVVRTARYWPWMPWLIDLLDDSAPFSKPQLVPAGGPAIGQADDALRAGRSGLGKLWDDILTVFMKGRPSPTDKGARGIVTGFGDPSHLQKHMPGLLQRPKGLLTDILEQIKGKTGVWREGAADGAPGYIYQLDLPGGWGKMEAVLRPDGTLVTVRPVR